MLSTKNINFTKIESLAAFGCSFVYGEELKDPSKYSWVSILGKLLKIPNINNFGIQGDSTPRICLRAMIYIERIKTTESNNDPSKMFIIIMTSTIFRKLYSYKINQESSLYISLRHTSITKYDKTNITKFYPHYQQNILFNFYNLTSFNNYNSIKRQVKLLDAYLKQSGHPYAIVPCDHGNDFIGYDVKGYLNEFTLSRGFPIGPNNHPLEEGNCAYAQYLYKKLTTKSS